ncbi:isocitrate/isopropylmalate family dehydrogenase [Zongyangia hominis]|uniref:Isocitrate/isopropylmalate dehydrogenase family protein n=1 Tax=Zongyangia hominis TaxID=2763677 RepID=A0A926IC44_9FIRM|nr:isocitrate/isopropylmalate family dehydrogenase [Zongyangia hominis]MBC8570963.1 isocitrate/isopropylmalate dehydrogenase family protein [Zongyangia hominis]
MEKKIEAALEKYQALIENQLARVARMKADTGAVDYTKLNKIVIGVCGGDGIGPVITSEAHRVLEYLLRDEVKKGRVEFKVIDGLTIENRVKANKAIPDDVLEELKKCDVILKGPTTTPRAGDPWPNIESANVAMRKELDLFANVRPVKVPDKGIDWTFFRENTEGAYTLGSCGLNVDDDLAFDFTVTTSQGTERIARLAYEYARNNNKGKVSIITKANVVKTTDGKFLRICQEIGKEYPEIVTDDWYIDITTAKLIDEKRRSDFKVFILPNLYGDIITDEAAEFQGGVGTAGSANLGNHYAMFEAIHGSAPRMVAEGRDKYADPCSMLRATVMLLSHIGYQKEADKLERALDKCMYEEKKYVITGRDNGATCKEFGDYVMETTQKL